MIEDGLWDLDLAEGSTFWSSRVYELLGVSQPGLDALLRVVHPDDRSVVDHVIERATTQPGPYLVTHRVLRGDEVATIDQHIESVADASGVPIRLVGRMREHRPVPSLLRATSDTGRSLVAELAHDFNNALLVIQGHAELQLRDTPNGDPRRSGVNAVLRAAHRASALTRALVALDRLATMRPKRVSAAALMDQLSEAVAATVDSAVALDIDIDASLGSVDLMVDIDQVRSTVLDLFVDACAAEAGEIRLSAGVQHVDPAGSPSVVPGSQAPTASADRYVIVSLMDDRGDPALAGAASVGRSRSPAASVGSRILSAVAEAVAARSEGIFVSETTEAGWLRRSMLLPVLPPPITDE